MSQRLEGTETILVVENETAVRDLILDVLSLYGYTVLAAADGAEALCVAAAHPGPIHLAVVDIVMPGMTGDQLVRRLRQARPAIRVLYVSGYTDELIRQPGALRVGPNFLQKPFTVEGLARKVREILDADGESAVSG